MSHGIEADPEPAVPEEPAAPDEVPDPADPEELDPELPEPEELLFPGEPGALPPQAPKARAAARSGKVDARQRDLDRGRGRMVAIS
jgi:hypothetical protein